MPQDPQVNRTELIASLLDEKLGKLADWTMPNIGHCVGPDGREDFCFFTRQLEEVKESISDFLEGIPTQQLPQLTQLNESEDLDHALLDVWEEHEHRRLEQLRRHRLPPISAGFGHPEFLADFDFWGQSPKFTLREAVLLSLGVEPDEIPQRKLDKLLRARKESLWPAEIYLLRRCDQFSRFFHFTGFGYTTMSARELNLAFEKLGIEVHPEFKSRLDARWKLREPSAPEKVESFSSQEKRTLLKLVAAMACEQYNFDPKARRSDAVSLIRDDLEFIGENMDSKTIRKWLLEAMEFVSQDYWKKPE